MPLNENSIFTTQLWAQDYRLQQKISKNKNWVLFPNTYWRIFRNCMRSCWKSKFSASIVQFVIKGKPMSSRNVNGANTTSVMIALQAKAWFVSFATKTIFKIRSTFQIFEQNLENLRGCHFFSHNFKFEVFFLVL